MKPRRPRGGPRYVDHAAPSRPPPPPTYFDLEPGTVRLDNNTNPRPHPAVRRAGRIARSASLQRYGRAWGARLRAELARHYGVEAASLMVGNGSDEILDAAARSTLARGRRGAMVRPGYDIYAALVYRQGAALREIRLDRELAMPDLGECLEGVDLLYLASPHNPTGAVLERRTIDRIAAHAPGLVVLDQAYAEYAGLRFPRPAELPENLLVVRTFSKAWGLAGLRVGYAVGAPALIDRVQSYRIPFTVGTLSEEIAAEALRRPGFVRATVARVRAERPRLTAALRRRGFRVFPSRANFLFTYPPVDAEGLWKALRDRAILVRRVPDGNDGAGALRITVGDPRETDRLLLALDGILTGAR